ncbi:hypothetical protein A3731_24665 [Roseovarius sp. HI0049]|nr:hypothetical protein A3731_24665 [Roseovarius sp. HI0049]
MNGDKIEPPEHGVWARAVADANAETEASGGRAFTADRLAARADYLAAKTLEQAADTPEKLAEARSAVAKAKEALRRALPRPLPHAGRRRPDLWATWIDVLNEMGGSARLAAALRDPVRSEALIGAFERWEFFEGDPVAAYREHHGIEDKRNARTCFKYARKKLDKLPDEYMAALITELTAAALEVEDREGAPQGHEVGRAARKAARALADLRALVVQAEEAAPPALGGQPQAKTQARLRLFADIRGALECDDDTEFIEAVWYILTGAEELPEY